MTSAKSGDTIFLTGGTCTEDVKITKDDITLSGNKMGNACDKDDPSTSADATIDGTITVDGVRARIEFLGVTGSGDGVIITNRGDATLVCNDIFDNELSGVTVLRSSNGLLIDNTVRGNGRRNFDDPFIDFGAGLFVGDASSVQSNGNTYENNSYAAIEAGRQSSFHNSSFLPRDGGNPPIAEEKDTIIQKGGDPGTASTCTTTSFGPVAIAAFNNGMVDLRHADVCGEIDIEVNSTFRIDDGGGSIIGTVWNFNGSWVAIRDRELADGRDVSFVGTLRCGSFSGRFGSFSQTVHCGQICVSPGVIPNNNTGVGSNCRQPQCSDGLDNDADTEFDLDDMNCDDPFDDDESG